VDGGLARGPFPGLDWFLLNPMVYSLRFVPRERLFARLPGHSDHGRDPAGQNCHCTRTDVRSVLLISSPSEP
jgi:hypothetical protein